MSARRKQVRLQDIVGKRVVDSDGRIAGRLEEVFAEVKGDQCRVVEYRLGANAALARLGISARRLTGLAGDSKLLRIPWDALDISDPENLRLLVSVDEIRRQQK